MRARRSSPDDTLHDAIEKFYRFRTCPACRVERMMFQVNQDAMQCPDARCSFVLSGRTNRQGEDAILEAVENHQNKASAMTTDSKPPRTIEMGYLGKETEEDIMRKGQAVTDSIFERLEDLNRRVKKLEEHAGYTDAE